METSLAPLTFSGPGDAYLLVQDAALVASLAKQAFPDELTTPQQTFAKILDRPPDEVSTPIIRRAIDSAKAGASAKTAAADEAAAREAESKAAALRSTAGVSGSVYAGYYNTASMGYSYPYYPGGYYYSAPTVGYYPRSYYTW